VCARRRASHYDARSGIMAGLIFSSAGVATRYCERCEARLRAARAGRAAVEVDDAANARVVA
jgi:hypothetical protein